MKKRGDPKGVRVRQRKQIIMAVLYLIASNLSWEGIRKTGLDLTHKSLQI